MGAERRHRATPRFATVARTSFMGLGALLLVALTAGGCRNACQATCVQLAEFSRECGVTVPDEQVDACFESQRNLSSEDREACRAFGGARALDDTLSCQDLDLFWGDAAAGAGP